MSAQRPDPAGDMADAPDPIGANASSDEAPDTDVAVVTTTAPPLAIASERDATGAPLHRGWSPLGARHRWMEPFVLALLAGGAAHGYAIVGELSQLGITTGAVDVGQVYRTLRDLEEVGEVRSTWMTGTGPARRDYELTESGFAALDEWAAVMKERARLVAEFEARYLESVALPRQGAGSRAGESAEGVAAD
ncbi:MAG: helix-turn-helix transcriptional regulator [Chloroflexi bacterium]|nr:helix-turn-helix transcriptional regulator [Chloroflexota bacterium]